MGKSTDLAFFFCILVTDCFSICLLILLFIRAEFHFFLISTVENLLSCLKTIITYNGLYLN